MKVILVGHPGSQHIVPISKFLTSKYLPKDWEVTYLNYTGEISGWADFVRNHLETITDDLVVFALDDYLISMPANTYLISVIEKQMKSDQACVSVKLCETSEQEHEEYPVTTQFTVWKRTYLQRILSVVNTPWEFEMKGSVQYKSDAQNVAMLVDNRHMRCLIYNTSSALSSRWQGVDMKGVGQEDIEEMTRLGLLGIVEDVDKKARIVVFGASGYLGTALVARLISQGYTNILAVARNEGSLVALKEKFQVEIAVGDIVDPFIVKKAMAGAEMIFHLAAMKHVGLAEKEPRSCISTNVFGHLNIINESLLTKPKVVMFISSDKASQGTGIYGASKKMGERLMEEAQAMNPATMYRVIRYGNVWNSTGSISTKWKPKMEKGEEVIITDPEASRFFWTVDEAVSLIFECMEKATDATPYIPKMKAVKMGVVLEAMMDVYGKSPVKTIGLQPGENKVETTDGVIFSDQVEQFTKEEFKAKFLSSPTFSMDRLKQGLKAIEQIEKRTKITAVLITKEKEYPQIILDRLTCDGFFDEIIIKTECPSIYYRYKAASQAKNDIIYVQDDDCLVNHQVLFNSYKGQIVNTMTEPFQEKYKDSGCTLVGWGCFFPKSALAVLDRFIAKYGEADPHLLREADRVFTFLNPFNTVIMPHEDLRQATASDRMGYDPDHDASMWAALVKAKVLVD